MHADTMPLHEVTMFGFLKEAGGDWIAGMKRKRCDLPACSRWLTVGSFKARRVGVQMGSSWYCSYGCFHGAAQEQIAAILAGRPRYTSSKPRMTLGLELIGRGLLTPEQLRFTAAQMLAGGMDAGDLFVANGFVTEAQVAAGRAAIWGCPVYSPSPAAIACGIHIPPVLAACSLALPVHYVPSTRQLLLGFLRGVDYELIFALEKMTGCTAKACLVKPSDFYLHEAHTRQPDHQTIAPPSERIFETAHSASERARILCNYGASHDAHSVKMILCKNYLWARLQGDSGMSDLLFKLAE